ncbi:uroporphyrinogen-III synthase [Dyella sedimenti]|uniref:uroporphyrinogen-III synthase n=1 Tax=Dyella sedimenti TaxID=2919947 RepID=UPI001FAA6217|nr:uroporphyrinogen-III synthase [Dyella sedimenti]
MTAPPPSATASTLQGRIVVITRPAGTGSPLARRVRRLGGVPLLLPGLSLRGAPGGEVAAALREALADDVLAFTSPAAVRFAARLAPLRTKALVFAVGQGTAQALRRHGVSAQAPAQRQDSEGLLAHPALADLRGMRVALVGAPGGRGLLREVLAARGARLREVHVYRRGAPRWNRRQLEALMRLPADARVLLSSAEALEQLRRGLPADALARLRAAVAVASSERLAEAACAAGFARVTLAASAMGGDMLAAAAR